MYTHLQNWQQTKRNECIDSLKMLFNCAFCTQNNNLFSSNGNWIAAWILYICRTANGPWQDTGRPWQHFNPISKFWPKTKELLDSNVAHSDAIQQNFRRCVRRQKASQYFQHFWSGADPIKFNVAHRGPVAFQQCIHAPMQKMLIIRVRIIDANIRW